MVVALSAIMLKILHMAVLHRYPDNTVPGYMSEGMVEGCMDYAMTFVFGYEPFPDIITKASALLHSIITFHPFVDGNKRTALLATFFFLYFNGYSFTITEDAIQFTRSIALGKIKRVEVVAQWLSKNSARSLSGTLFHKLFFSRWKERELTVFCITMLRQISDLLRPFEQKYHETS